MVLIGVTDQLVGCLMNSMGILDTVEWTGGERLGLVENGGVEKVV